jgi:cell division protein FtsQ
MSRRTPTRSRNRSKQINILHTTTTKRHSNKQIMQATLWCVLVLGMVLAVGTALHFGISFALDRVLFNNPHYVLSKIEIEPRDRFSERLIRQATGLEHGQNLWALNLRQITHDLEKLPSVSSAKVERHFPDKIVISIKERVPVVKIYGLNSDLNTREEFYLDSQSVVLKPRNDENVPLMPEIIGLSNNNAELEPGMKLDLPTLTRAMEILDAIEHSRLHTTIDIATINLSDPLSITMVTRGEMSITFRLDCIDQQLARLVQIVEYPDFQMRQIRSVDLTPDINVPVTFAQYQ